MKRITKFNIVKAVSSGGALLLPVIGNGADPAANAGNIVGSSALANLSRVVNAGIHSGTMGSSVSQTAASGNEIAVDSSALVDEIRLISTMEDRAAVIAKVEALVESTVQKVEIVRAVSAGLDEKTRTSLNQSMSKVEALAQAVLKNAEEVRDAWESEIIKASARLAARFEAFTESTVDLEAAVRSAGISLGK